MKNKNKKNRFHFKKQSSFDIEDYKKRISIFDNINPIDKNSYFKKLKNDHEEMLNSSGFKYGLKNFFLKIHSLFNFLYINFYFKLILSVCSFYAIFGNYIRLIFFEKNLDEIFDYFIFICIFIFFFEIVVNLYCEKSYFFKYKFFLDLIIFFSLFTDVSFIGDFFLDQNNNFWNSFVFFEIMKIFRILRLLRVLKFYQKKKFFKKKKNFQTRSKISKSLKSKNTNRVFFLIIFILILIPLFDIELWFVKNTDIKNKIEFFLPILINYPNKNNTSLKNLKKRFSTKDQELVYLKINKNEKIKSKNLPNLRKKEINSETLIIFQKKKLYKIKIIISKKKRIRFQAILELLKTILYFILIIISINQMNKQISLLILKPLERMITKIKLITEDPLKALKIKKKNFINKEEMNETIIIEANLNKLSKLLIMNFGQAGCSFISRILKDPERELNDFKKGEEIFGVFGFCKINEFFLVFDDLDLEIVIFINSIAEVVHETVYEFNGKVFCNFENYFLVIWKFYTNNNLLNGEKIQRKKVLQVLAEDPINDNLAESAILSFINIILKIGLKKNNLKKWKTKKIRNIMTNQNIKIGFGIHVGWAIEGAFGSVFKIDTSYLSKDINITKKLGNYNQRYKKQIIFSGDFFKMIFNKDILENCRFIDQVKRLKIYCIDLSLDFNNLKKSRVSKLVYSKAFENLEKDFYLKNENDLKKLKKTEKNNFDNEKKNQKFLADDKMKSVLNKKIGYSEFVEYFKIGRNLFLNGDWSKSCVYIEKALDIFKEDGPSLYIYNFMKKYNFRKPYYLTRK